MNNMDTKPEELIRQIVHDEMSRTWADELIGLGEEWEKFRRQYSRTYKLISILGGIIRIPKRIIKRLFP
jgi:hypothetical protein